MQFFLTLFKRPLPLPFCLNICQNLQWVQGVKIWYNVLYWLLLLSTNNCKSRLWRFISTYQSFRSKRSLISGVYFTTETILNSQKVKTQKAKVAAESKSGCSHFHSETHEAFTIKKLDWILQFWPPSSSPPFALSPSLLRPKGLLTWPKQPTKEWATLNLHAMRHWTWEDV